MTGIATGGDAQGDTLVGIDNLIGSNFDDTLECDTNGSVLNGCGGTDTLSFTDAAAGIGGVGVTVNSFSHLGRTRSRPDGTSLSILRTLPVQSSANFDRKRWQQHANGR